MSEIEGMTGYLHPAYAKSLAEFGTPHELPACGGWILVRSIPHREERDAMGCYPLLACREWRHLPQSLAEIGKDLVTLALVTDPFANVGEEFLRQQFDIAKPFKGLGSGVFEIALPLRGSAFRVLYAVQIGDDIWILHAFQKKSTQGIKTPQHEIDLIKNRLKNLRELLG